MDTEAAHTVVAAGIVVGAGRMLAGHIVIVVSNLVAHTGSGMAAVAGIAPAA